MVQHYQSPVRVYKHPFALVMLAYERRFPTCPQIPVFVGCEVTLDEESLGGAIRKTERRCKLNVEAPYILKKIIGVDFVYFIQRNVLDRRNSVLEIEACNESFSSRVAVVEKCKYYIHPENPNWTCFEQTASLDIKNFFGFESSMEKLAMKQYAQNIAKGKEIIEYFVNELKEEGITHAEPWADPALKKDIETVALKKGDGEAIGTEESNDSDGKLPSSRDMQLSSDYIARYLGKLNMMQESKLVQLRHSIEELRGSSVPGDATLLRFLRAREFSVEKAREMLTQSLHWRKKHQVDKLLDEYEAPQVVKDYFPGGWHHFDKDGRPLYVLRLGQMDVKGLLKSIGEDEVLLLQRKFVRDSRNPVSLRISRYMSKQLAEHMRFLLGSSLHVCEEGLQLMDEATTTWGYPVSQWTLLIDLEGLNMRHLWRPGIKALLRIIEIVEANYPETMGRVLIIRAPRCFPILWTLISTFIHENTRNKFVFSCGTDYQEQGNGGLTDYINQDVVPDFLGGPSEEEVCEVYDMVPRRFYVTDPEAGSTFIVDGGVVPKQLYRLDLAVGASTEHEHSLYQSISLSRGQVHNVVIHSNDPGAVLTWDFDVMRHNVTFTVLRKTKNTVSEDASASSRSASTNGETDAAATKEWKEGVDCVKVEPSVLCHDGESIQGTHIMQVAGSYILQWQYQEDQVERLPAITSHKAQLMYFYETLPSAQYRGSMMSLQSAVSGKSIASSSLSR